MTPTPTTTLPPRTVQEILTRAGRPDFDRWAEQVSRCGHCSRPVRLRGRVEHRSANGGRVAYSTDGEPDQVLLIRCGNRRAAVCPSCSFEYAPLTELTPGFGQVEAARLGLRSYVARRDQIGGERS